MPKPPRLRRHETIGPPRHFSPTRVAGVVVGLGLIAGLLALATFGPPGWLSAANLSELRARGIAGWQAMMSAKDNPASTVNIVLPVAPGPPPVADLAALPAIEWPSLARRYLSAFPQPDGAGLRDGWLAAEDCHAFERRAAAAVDADRSRAGEALAQPGPNRVRLPVAIPVVAAEGRVLLPQPVPGMVQPIAQALTTGCRNVLRQAGLPLRFAVTLSGDTPWPADVPIGEGQPMPTAVLADMVLDLERVEPADDGGSANVVARPVALYLWRDSGRAQAWQDFGATAPGSQRPPPVVAAPPPPPPLQRTRPLPPGAAPPVVTFPQVRVETGPLPPPLAGAPTAAPSPPPTPPTPTAQEPAAEAQVVAQSEGILRAGPDHDRPGAGRIKAGQVLILEGRSVSARGEAWLAVRLADGVRGYFPERMTRPQRPVGTP